jgi:multiple sugar transport system substrate-binding protein
MNSRTKIWRFISTIVIIALFVAGCTAAVPPAAPDQEPQIVIETVVVEKEVVVERQVVKVEEVERLITPTAFPKEPVTIKVMSFFAFDNPEVEQGVVEKFQQAYPWISVELDSVPFSDFFITLTTRMAGGKGPDVVSMNFENMRRFASLGALAELDYFIQRDNYDMNQYYENTVKMWQYQNRQYAIPATFSTVALFYNKAIFDSAVIPYPDQDWDWKKMVEVGKLVTRDTNGDGIIDQFGTSIAWWPVYLYMNDADVLTPDGMKCALTQPAAVEALQKMVDLSLVDKIAPTRGDLATQGDWDMFIAGRLAFWPTGPWAVVPFQENIKNFDWDIADMPGLKKRATFLFGNSYAIPVDSKHHDAAWEFVKFATGQPGSTIRQQGGYEISPIRTVAEGEFLKTLEGKPPTNAGIFMNATSYANLPPAHPLWNQMHDVIWPELEKALLGTQTVQEGMEKACVQIDMILAEGQ